MDRGHLTFELVQAVAAGERPFAELAAVTLRHLAELCPHCKEVLAHEVLTVAWNEEQEEPATAAPRAHTHHPGDRERYAKAYEDASERAVVALFRRRQPSRAARPRLEALLRLSAEEREQRLRSAPEYLGNLPLVELLLTESFNKLPDKPEEALGFARLAKAVLQHAEPSALVAELYARAMAYTGNALRVLGRLQEAADDFDHARFLLRREGGTDRLTIAEIDRLESSLRRDQRRLPEAVELLSRALLVYRGEKQQKQVTQTLLGLDVVYREQGEFEKGLHTIQQALELIDGAEEPRLLLMARHNLAERYGDLGDFLIARKEFEGAMALYERFPDAPTQLRRLWLEGNIARGCGATQTAESCYRAAREGWQRERRPFDMALVSLDLAQLLLHQGRTSELKPLAEEVVSVFESAGVHREAQAAVMLFADAVRLEQLTAAYVLELARFLEVSRSNPALAFARAM